LALPQCFGLGVKKFKGFQRPPREPFNPWGSFLPRKEPTGKECQGKKLGLLDLEIKRTPKSQINWTGTPINALKEVMNWTLPCEILKEIAQDPKG